MDRRGRRRKTVLRIGAAASLFLVGCLAVLWLVWAAVPLPPHVLEPPRKTVRILDRFGWFIAEVPTVGARSQEPVRIDEMGEWLPKVTIALEDHRYREHHGVDWRALAGAFVANLKAGRVVRGASTVTQQYIKMVDDPRPRTLPTKLRELVLARKLERAKSKNFILEEYLNRLDYGNRLIGPESAARAYFGKSAANLTLPEAAFLAGIPQSPTRRNPWLHPEAALVRYRRCLKRLAELGMIEDGQLVRWSGSPPVIQENRPRSNAPHFVATLLERHPSDAGELVSTLDLELQKTAEAFARSHLRRLNRHDVTAAAMVVIDNATGGVRALVGSPDFARSQINGALMRRSCGSVLKPFVYLLAFDERRITAATLLPDTAEAVRGAYADYDPRNYDERFLGPVRAREALANSLNVPAVVVLSRLGARRAFHRLRDWGIDFAREFDDCGAGFILGNAEVSLLGVSAAYAGLAREGMAGGARFLRDEHEPIRRRASREAALLVADILSDNQARQRTFGRRSPLAFEERVAVKTGTSSGFRDAWTVGFNRTHTVGVWVGNFDGRPMREMLSVRAAAPLWRMMMDHLLRRDEPLEALEERTVALRRITVCSLTGRLPGPNSAETIPEWFLPGTEPVEEAGTLLQLVEGKPVLFLPREYAGWCDSPHNHLGARVLPDSDLRILSPRPNAKYRLDPVLPPEQQMIRFTASWDGLEPLRWTVNGEVVPPDQDGRVFWQLRAGKWKVVVESGTERDAVSITVLES